MGKDLICERLERYREAAKQKCVTLDVTPDDFIDDEHLDCLWYDGAYAFLKYKDMDVVLSVQGEVTLKGTCGGREIFYRNSYRGPDPCADLDCQIRDDVELYRLLGAEWAEEKEDHLILEDNNWIEYFCGDAGLSDLTGAVNVLDAIGEVIDNIESIYAGYVSTARHGERV